MTRRKKLFQIGDKVVLKRHRYSKHAAKIGATATVTEEERYLADWSVYVIGVKWDRDNGLDKGQQDGDYYPGDFGLWNATKNDPRKDYHEILEVEESSQPYSVSLAPSEHSPHLIRIASHSRSSKIRPWVLQKSKAALLLLSQSFMPRCS